MKIKISYENRAVIPSGIPYSNQNPCYSMTREIEIPDDTIEEQIALFEWKHLHQIKNVIDGHILKDFISMRDFALREEPPEDHYRIIDGIKVPRVTAIISPDKPNIPFLEDHGELGTHLDKVMKNYIDTGVLTDMLFVDKGNIKMTWTEVFEATEKWVKDYPLKFVDHSKKVFNEEFMYCGEIDAISEWGDGFAICDFKKTKTLSKDIVEKYFMQMAAYANAYETAKIDSMVICSPFNPPMSAINIEEYFNKFKNKREEYRKRYGI